MLRQLQLCVKRIVDLTIAIVALVLLSPLLGLLIVAIRVDSRGPAFFRQWRAGKDGRPFQVWKFRTMYVDTPPVASSPNSPDDPRITRVGRWLRETLLDELPQLFNVLRGEMSLVGPRPVFLEHIAGYSDRERKRLLMRPGMTGLAAVVGRARMTWPERLALDVEYVETWSLWLDLKIMLKTPLLLLRREDAYETSDAKGPQGFDE